MILTSQGRAFNRPPEVGSVAAQVRSIADRNEALGLPPVPVEVPVFVTKDDAREAQSAESTVYGGQNPRGGMAAQMQVGYSLPFQSVLMQHIDNAIECSR